MKLSWVYNRDLFDAWRAEQMAEHYLRVLASIIRDPEATVRTALLANAFEKQEIIKHSAGKEEHFPATTLNSLFEQQVERTPEGIAVSFEGKELRYRELDERSGRVAGYLAARGVRPEDVVAILGPRSIDTVISLIAVLKTGAAYLAVDSEHPTDRQLSILRDAAVVLALSTAPPPAEVARQVPVIILSQVHPEEMPGGAQGLRTDPSKVLPQNSAYLIYTSGSTGQPKGVLVSHHAIVNHMLWMQAAHPLTASDRVLQKTSMAFDASVWEFFAPLLSGAELVLCPPGLHREPQGLVKLIKDYRISILQVVPSFLSEFLHHQTLSQCPALRRVFCGGEVLTPELQKRFFASSAADLFNLYGPTEATIDATSTSSMRQERDHGIGRPITNVRTYVLDSRLEPVPVGIAGELYVAGEGLARGYINRPSATSERFVADPYGPAGSRMYRTGDCARWFRDGNLEYLGRTDHQIKIRGFRVELNEVASAIRAQRGVRDAAVVARAKADGEQALIGYVVPTAGETLNGTALRHNLEQTLPQYMLPAVILTLPALPLTENGKLDTANLPDPYFETGTSAIGPSTQEEELLCVLFQEMLGLECVGIHDNFFDMGGHSLLAMRLVSRIRETFGVAVTVRDLFDAPTVEGIGTRLRDTIGGRLESIHVQERPDQLPLSYAQRGLWFINELERKSTHYNRFEALRLTGLLNCEALTKAVNAIVQRHEVLRTNFIAINGEPVQVVDPALRIIVPVQDLTRLSQQEQKDHFRVAVERETQEPFDLAYGPLLRMKLLKMSEQEHVLLRTVHHIVSDGWSDSIFNRELSTLYDAYVQGAESPLKPLQVQYADFALWQRRWLAAGALNEGLNFWKQQLAGVPERLELPTDRPRPAERTSAAGLFHATVPADVVAKLKQLSQDNRVTLYMTLLAAFGVLLSRYSGQDNIVVGSPVANRQEAALEDLIGLFVNPLVMRIRVEPEMSFQDLLQDVRRTALDAFRHQYVPFELLVRELAPARILNANPLFQVWLVLQNAPLTPTILRSLRIERVDIPLQHVRFDLELHIFENGDQLTISWVYSSGLFDQWRIKQMAEHYLRVMGTLVSYVQ